MNLSQCKVFDWLTFTARIEGGAIVDIYASLYNNTAPGGQTDVLMANAELNDLEKDEVVYKAIVEVEGERLF